MPRVSRPCASRRTRATDLHRGRSRDGCARLRACGEIVPLHYEGWQHFSKVPAGHRKGIRSEGLSSRLRWLPPGQAQLLALEPGMSTAHDGLA